MKSIFIIAILLFFIISCNQVNYKTDLIGNWYYNRANTGFIEFNFYQDSVRVKDGLGIHIGEWKIDSDQIILKIIKSDSKSIGERFEYDYELKNDKKELFLRVHGDKIIEFSNFIKAKDSATFLINRFD